MISLLRHFLFKCHVVVKHHQFSTFYTGIIAILKRSTFLDGECGGLVVEPLTPEREVGGTIPTSAVLCPGEKTHLLPDNTDNTREAVIPSRYD